MGETQLVPSKSVWLIASLVIILVMLVLTITLLGFGGPANWFDALKGFFSLMAAYIISQMALLLRP
jgi:hypothetical protein